MIEKYYKIFNKNNFVGKFLVWDEKIEEFSQKWEKQGFTMLNICMYKHIDRFYYIPAASICE